MALEVSRPRSSSAATERPLALFKTLLLTLTYSLSSLLQLLPFSSLHPHPQTWPDVSRSWVPGLAARLTAVSAVCTVVCSLQCYNGRRLSVIDGVLKSR